MKKFISMVMAAAMVVTMVPATAFAASVTSTTAKVVDKWEVTAVDADKEIGGAVHDFVAPELQLTLNGVEAKAVAEGEEITFTLKLDNAKVLDGSVALKGSVTRPSDAGEEVGTVTATTVEDSKEIEVTIKEAGASNFRDGDVVNIELTDLVLIKQGVGKVATVKATGDVKSEAIVFAEVVSKGIKAELAEDDVDPDGVVVVAPEESEALDKLVIKPTAGYDFEDVLTYNYALDGTEWKQVTTGGTDAKIVLKLNKGFEFLNGTGAAVTVVPAADEIVYGDDTITIYTSATAETEITVDGMVVEATKANAGEVATITVSTAKLSKVAVEVAKVVDFKVVMELADADEDVPVFYNGVDSKNTGLTVDDDHISLEVKIYETFKGAWSNHKDFKLTLPEGVYVVEGGVVAEDVNTTFTGTPGDTRYDYNAKLVELFENAYVRGDYEEFSFKRGLFNETHDHDDAAEAHEITFTLKLVAEPTFVGDVVLTLEGAALDTQEVTIAKFVAPYTVKAEQNDVIIDYRYTEVDTPIVVTEAEAGLWADGTVFAFAMEKVGTTADDYLVFEDAATVEVNAESEMEINDEVAVNKLGFEVEEVSDEEAAVVTISGIELFMQRNIPAGPYALEMDVEATTTMVGFLGENLLKADGDTDIVDDIDADDFVVQPAFVNVVTAGRDQSDSSFTTTVVVPVGETTMYAGDKAIALEVPAYINAAGYIMVPVRAVANALGIANDCVQWNQAAKTVIIMYGDRLITMAAGESTIYVSGAALPAASSVEIVNGRAFLGLRDLANALGVKTIAWDPATKVGTLNPVA